MAEDGLLGAAGDAAQPAPAQQQAEAGDCPGPAASPAAAAAGPAAAASPQEQQQDAGLSSASPETPAIGPEAWAAQRRAWANPRKRRAGGEGGSPEQLAARQAAIPPDADYDSLLGPPYQQFSAPIPLPEMIEFLTDCWALAIGLD